MSGVAAVRTVRYSVIRGDTFVACCPSFVHTFFCAALVPLPLFLLPYVSGGHVSALEITFQKLFSVDLFCILLKFTHFKFVSRNHCRWGGTIYAFGSSVVSLLCVAFSTECLHRRQISIIIQS